MLFVASWCSFLHFIFFSVFFLQFLFRLNIWGWNTVWLLNCVLQQPFPKRFSIMPHYSDRECVYVCVRASYYMDEWHSFDCLLLNNFFFFFPLPTNPFLSGCLSFCLFFEIPELKWWSEICQICFITIFFVDFLWFSFNPVNKLWWNMKNALLNCMMMMTSFIVRFFSLFLVIFVHSTWSSIMLLSLFSIKIKWKWTIYSTDWWTVRPL